jgi:hypothetical protein
MGHRQHAFAATAKVGKGGAMVGRIAVLVVLGALLAGCDKCGGWYWSSWQGETQACRQQAPRPQ